jgi:hypothetical protein
VKWARATILLWPAKLEYSSRCDVAVKVVESGIFQRSLKIVGTDPGSRFFSAKESRFVWIGKNPIVRTLVIHTELSMHSFCCRINYYPLIQEHRVFYGENGKDSTE